MSIHERFESVVDVYVAGGLDEAERREVEEHAGACAACGTALQDASEFARWVRGTVAPDAPPADLEDRIVARLRGGAKPARKRLAPGASRMLRWAVGLAAVVCLVALGGVFTERQDATKETEFPVVLDSLACKIAPLEEYSRRNLEDAVGVGGGAGGGGVYGGRMGGRENLVARGGGAAAEREKETGRDELQKKAERAGSAAPDDRKIIRNADLSVEVDSYDAAYAKIGEIVSAEKGYVAGADTQRLANGKMRAKVTMRIPPERFDAVLAKLRDLGTVRNQSITSQDVTKAYVDLQSRLGSKETLAERLRKILAEQKGTVKELMEVEVQLGATIEAIEQIKGEIKYYDNLVGLTTIVVNVFEKDLGQPFEYVQTLQANIELRARDTDSAYAEAQKVIRDAGGQIVDSSMVRESDGNQTGMVTGRVDSEKFPAVREAMRKLGHVETDTVNQQQKAQGGQDGQARPDAPVKKEQAVVKVTIKTPPVFVVRKTQIVVETPQAETAYESARRAVETAGGIPHGPLSRDANGVRATVETQIDADKYAALMEQLKALGTVKNETSTQEVPQTAATGSLPLVREQAKIELTIATPPRLVTEEEGIGARIRNTFAGSWKGLLWSIEKLFVGLSLAGPWLVLAALAWIVYRRVRARKAAKQAASH